MNNRLVKNSAANPTTRYYEKLIKKIVEKNRTEGIKEVAEEECERKDYSGEYTYKN